MTRKGRFIWFVLVLGALFLILAFWYKYEYSMDIIEEFEVNSPNYSQKLLIATQGSDFKNEVSKGIVNYFEKDSFYIKVIDITKLADIDPADYNAIVVIHTWENWQPPADVELFINRTRNIQNKIIVLTTSGEGSYKMEGIDAITGESKIENSSSYINQITKRLESILNINSS
ncbi:hypothetical protein [Psychroserpens sp.]|uniref:hypothetical protein n=1 Tax=Psychroserpens sp. TaxID=2020870 RepID=UPI002B26E958|nr:hypothetical protein [Psychroserpens sp.]